MSASRRQRGDGCRAPSCENECHGVANAQRRQDARSLCEFHRNPANKAIHWVCMPLIVWSVLGMLWGASPVAAYVAIAATMVFYMWLSLPLALGMFGVIALMVWPLTLLGSRALIVSIAVFVAAWIGQFIGHMVEGRKPAFLEDVR